MANIFEQLQEKKSKRVMLANKAAEYGWIDKQQEQEIVNKINNDVLTIGVIGQMKCGKSTFLNSFVFEDDVLPAATTPMTAALSVITYGETKKIVADFYTADEWEEQKLQASRSLEEVAGNTLEESKVKAAKELVGKSKKLGSSLNTLLGKTQEDKFENLIEYVGADGKYISITKSVTIYYPKDYLKGVEIVDTPGFNDPIVSREERTKKFLSKADVVLLMLYAGRPFDATDRDILFKNVRQCGIGKVLIGINKYDIPYENGETEDEIKNYVVEQIKSACRECGDDTLADILKEASPIPLSAEMALLSKLPMSKINENEAYSFAYKRNCSTFEISSQQQMAEKSLLPNLTKAIQDVIEKEKETIIFRKPINAIKAAANKKKEELETSLRNTESIISNLNKPDDELEEQKEKLGKAKRRLEKKINALGDDIDSDFQTLVRRGRNDMEDAVDSTCNSLRKIAEDWGTFQSFDAIKPRLDATYQKLKNRTLKRILDQLSQDAKSKLLSNSNDFFAEAEDILIRYVPNLDSKEVTSDIKKSISLDIEDKSVFSTDGNSGKEDDESFLDLVGIVFANFINRLSFGALGLAVRGLSHGSDKADLLSSINSISSEFDAEPYLKSIFNRKDEIINQVKEKFITNIIDPLQAQIDHILEKAASKESQLEEARNNLQILKNNKEKLQEQMQLLENL